MVQHTEPDQSLIRMPSMTAVKSFVAAARYQSFTRAAASLCVTQAAISRQVRELEKYLDTSLFVRVGRSVELTPSGATFFDAVQLSFLNIAQAADRIRRDNKTKSKHTLTLCCSPAFSALWLAPRLPRFFSAHPDIDLNLVTTENFVAMESGVQPDIFITKMAQVRPGYRNLALFHDVIFPICTPEYLTTHPEVGTLEGLRDAVLLNLGSYGRSQLAEHVDWRIWLSMHRIDFDRRAYENTHTFDANDYNMLIQMVLGHQGVALGWGHLVSHLIEQQRLTRPVDQELALEGTRHYLAWRDDAEDRPLELLCRWIQQECHLNHSEYTVSDHETAECPAFGSPGP